MGPLKLNMKKENKQQLKILHAGQAGKVG